MDADKSVLRIAEMKYVQNGVTQDLQNHVKPMIHHDAQFPPGSEDVSAILLHMCILHLVTCLYGDGGKLTFYPLAISLCPWSMCFDSSSIYT